MKRRVIALISAFALIASLMVVPTMALEEEAAAQPISVELESVEEVAQPISFTDLDGHWGKGTIEKWAEHGLVAGYPDGRFGPADELTRGALAMVLSRLMRYQSKAENTYGDLKDDAWYADAVLEATRAGVIRGDGVNARPEANITREETAVIMARVLGLAAPDESKAEFTDAAQISTWAVDAVNAMANCGYINGYNGAVNPKANISRAELLTMLDNMFAKLYDEEGIFEEDVAGNAIVNVPGVELKNMSVKGDLIVAQGVAEGVLVLRNVKLDGNLIVRGGGVNSIYIIGGSAVGGSVLLEKYDGEVRIVTDGKVDVVVIDDGSDEVILDGKFDDVSVVGADATVTVKGTIGTLHFEKSAAGATLDVAAGSTVSKVESAADNVTIAGSGKVTEVIVSEGEGVSVETKGTRIEVAEGAGAVTAGGKEIAPGTSGSTAGDTTGGTGGYTGGGSTPKDEVRSTIVLKRSGASNVKNVGTSTITVEPGTTAAQLMAQVRARDDVNLSFAVANGEGGTVTGSAVLEDGYVLYVTQTAKENVGSYKVEVYDQDKIDEWGEYWDNPTYQSIDAEVNAKVPAFKDVDYRITDAKYDSLIDKEFVEHFFVITETASNGYATNGYMDQQTIWNYRHAIQGAMDEASAQGGGRVILPANRDEDGDIVPTVYYTGALWIKSNVNLHIEEGVTLKFVRNIDNESYPIVLTQFEGSDLYNYSPFIYALNEKNIAITGKGTIDGQADHGNWINWKNATSQYTGQRHGDYNPQANRLTGGYSSGSNQSANGEPMKAGDRIVGHNIDKVDVTRRIYTYDGQAPAEGTKIPVVEDGVTKWIEIPADAFIGSSHQATNNFTPIENVQSMLRPCFVEPYLSENVLIEGITIHNSPMWNIHPTLTNNILIRDVIVDSELRNNDGINPDSCKNVVIEDTEINTGDDCIAIKSGKNEDGQRRDTYSENIIIRRVNFARGHGGITIGSECAGAVRNLFTTDNAFNSASLQTVIRFKTNSKRSDKPIEKMYHKDSTVLRASNQFLLAQTQYSAGGIDAGDYGDFIPVIKDLYIYNFQSSRDGLKNEQGVSDNLGINSTRAFTIAAYARAPIANINIKNSTFIGVGDSPMSSIKNVTLENVTMTSRGADNTVAEKEVRYDTTPVVISEVKISDGTNTINADEAKDFEEQMVGSRTLTVTGKVDDSGDGTGYKNGSAVRVFINRQEPSNSGGTTLYDGTLAAVNPDGTFTAVIQLSDDAYSTDKANHFISIQASNDVVKDGAPKLIRGNQDTKVYKVRASDTILDIKTTASHANVTSLHAATKEIVVVSGTKVSDLTSQVEPAVTGETHDYTVIDWLGEEKIPDSNLDMLTTGDRLVVTNDRLSREYSIEVPGEAPYWDDVTYNSILAEVKAALPTFKDDVFNITDAKYASLIREATFNTTTVNDYTLVFRQAIKDCTENGGGMVLVPADTDPYYSGAIHLDNNVNLHVEAGATIEFLPINATGTGITPEDLFPRTFRSHESTDFYGYSAPVHADGKSGFAITGGGTIAYTAPGNGWIGDLENTVRQWNYGKTPLEQRDAFALGHKIGPTLIQIYNSKNFIISDVTLGNSAFWTTNLILCENVLVRGIKTTSTSSNSDGVNPDSSRNVIIENNVFANKDDNIAIKSGRGNNGALRDTPTERIIIRGNDFYYGTGLSVGSEVGGGANHIFVENNVWSGTGGNIGNVFRVKIANSLGDATIEKVFYRNCAIGKVAEAFISVEYTLDHTMTYATNEHYGTLNTVPTIRDIAMSNLFTVGEDSKFDQFFVKAEIQDLRPIKGFYLKDINLQTTGIAKTGSDYKYLMVNNVDLHMDNVKFNEKTYNSEKTITLTDVKVNGVALGSGTTAVTSTGDNGTIVVTGVVNTDIADFLTTGSVRVSYDLDFRRVAEANFPNLADVPIHWANATMRKVGEEILFTATLTGVGADIHDIAVVAKSNQLPHYVAVTNANGTVKADDKTRGTAEMVYSAANAYRVDVEGTLRALKVSYEFTPGLTPFHNVPYIVGGETVTVKVNIVDAKTNLPVEGLTVNAKANNDHFTVENRPYTAEDGYTFTITAGVGTSNNHIFLRITGEGYQEFNHVFRRVTRIANRDTLANYFLPADIAQYFPLPVAPGLLELVMTAESEESLADEDNSEAVLEETPAEECAEEAPAEESAEAEEANVEEIESAE